MAANISLKQFVQNTLTFMSGGVYDLFGRGKTWGAGEVLRVNPDQTIGSQPQLRFLTVASTDADITNAKGAGFSQVFNTWSRISYSAGNPHAVVSEESAWNFDETTGKINCTVNSTAWVGFVGPDYYDNYEMEVGLSAPGDSDDDLIGLVLAYLPNADGTADMLVASRGAGQAATGRWYFNIILNPKSLSAGAADWVVGGTNGTMHYPNGTPFPAVATVTNGGNGTWGDLGEITLKVIRTPTHITVYSSDKGTPSVYAEANKIVVDLTSDDRLTKFIHPSRIGYIAQSQPNSTYRVLTQPDFQAPIFDVRDGSMQVFEGGVWKTYAPGSDYVKAQIPQGILVSSIANTTVWYATYDGTLRKIVG